MNPRNRYLLDAGIFPLIFAGNINVKKIVNEIASGKAEPLVCEVNLAEFYAKTCEKKGKEIAELHHLRIRYQPKMTVITPDEELTRKAGWLKCKYRDKVSLADCYAAATSSINKSILITTDKNLAEVAKSEKIRTKLISF
jgi:predicted nucleic acid-binding protein